MGETPTAMVGKKIAPIWKDDDGCMAESLDIIAKLDPTGSIKPASGRKDFKAWQKSVQTPMRKLCRPRYVMSPLVPEFTQKSGRDAFVANHQMPPFEKADWKGNADMAIETKYGYYEAAYAVGPAALADADQGHRAAAQDQGLPRSLREEGRRAPLLQHGHLSTLGLSKMERAVVQSRASATVKMPAPRRCPLKFPSPNAHPAPSEPPPRATLS